MSKYILRKISNGKLHKNFNVVPFALLSRYRYTVTVIDRRPPLHTVTLPLTTVTDRHPPLLTVLRS
jgi:hypothetical protein